MSVIENLPNRPSRSGAFDAIRCGAAVGVVLLHASAPYFVNRMPGLTWPVFDDPSRIANGLGWSIELFIMPLFLLIAGYFTPGMYRKYQGWRFVKHRATRLLIPLLAAMIIILPATLYIWLTGWLIEGLIEPRKIRSLKFEAGIGDGLWGLSHLWFLLYLFTYGTAIIMARKWFPGVCTIGDNWKRFGACLVIGCGVVLMIEPQVVFGFQHAFLPVPSKWLYSGAFFLGGIWLAEAPEAKQWAVNHWRKLLIVGLLAMGGGVTFGNQMLAGDESMVTRLLASSLTVVCAWAISLAPVGWAIQSSLNSSCLLRYLAAASFWVYLIHHPIIALSHIQLKVVLPGESPTVKMLLSATIALAFSLLTFELFIRRRPFAAWFATPDEFRRASVRVTPNANETASVLCLKAFADDQGIETVASVNQPSKSASWVRFAKRTG